MNGFYDSTKRKNFLLDFFRSIDGFKPFKPEGAFYLYVSCEGFIGKTYGVDQIIKDDYDFVNFLLNNAKVAVVPGIAFGKSPYLGFLMPLLFKSLKKACDQIKESLKSLK